MDMKQNHANQKSRAQQEPPRGRGEGSQDFDGDDSNMSPRSLEHMQNISSGISQLVDDVVTPTLESSKIEDSMNNLRVSHSINQSYLQAKAPPRYDHLKGAGNEGAGMTPLPNQSKFSDSYKFQSQEVGEFNPFSAQRQIRPHKFSGSQQSHFSSDGEGSMANQHNEISDLAANPISTTPFVGDKFSMQSIFEHGSDYQEQLDKYGYIFQAPDIGSGQHPQTKPLQAADPQGGGYHSNPKQMFGYQQRASSFDKLGQNDPNHPSGNQLMHRNENHETISAVSNGNFSAYSEGDLYNQNWQTAPTYGGIGYPHQYMQGQVMDHPLPYSFPPPFYQQHSYGQPYQQMPFYNERNPYYQGEDMNEELTPKGQQFQTDIQITESEINLQKNLMSSSPKRNNSDSKFQGLQQQNVKGLKQKDIDFNSAQFKTPPSFRSSDPQQYLGSQTAPPHLSSKAPSPSVGLADPFYPQQMHNLRASAFGRDGQNMFVAGHRQNVQQPHHIGMTAPPMTRGFNFSHQDTNLLMGHMHGAPMAVFQQPQHQPSYNFQQPPQYKQQPLKMSSLQKQTSSQERESSYQIPNFTNQTQGQVPFSKTVSNTPTSVQDHSNSASSHNSNTSQQFSGLIMDHNETFLFQIIKQYDEAPTNGQKLDHLRGNVHKLALTQTGSRFLQKQLTKANCNIVSFFLEELGQHMPTLMVDNYGNYFCQRFLSSCSGDQRLSILKMIRHRFIEICCNKKGTHTIQTMFDLVNLPEEEEFIRSALLGNVKVLSMDSQGTHVVQKVLSSFDEARRQFVFDEVNEHFLELATNTNGLCVIKKLVQQTKSREQATKLMQKISKNVIELVQNPYGNYAITEVINNWDAEVCSPIFMKMRDKLSQLSIQKFSSNVIERCLEKANPKVRAMYIEEISASDKLSSVIRNSYGNYVVQKALRIADGQEKQQLINAIQRSIPLISDKKIRSKWEKIIEEAQPSQKASEDFKLHHQNAGDQDNEGHRYVSVAKRTGSSEVK